MTRLATICRHRSFTFALVALIFGSAALGRIFDFAQLPHEHGQEFVQQSIVLCVFSFVVCISVLANLVLDVGRGYSPSRCSLACVIMLAAFAGPVLLATTLVSYFSK